LQGLTVPFFTSRRRPPLQHCLWPPAMGCVPMRPVRSALCRSRLALQRAIVALRRQGPSRSSPSRVHGALLLTGCGGPGWRGGGPAGEPPCHAASRVLASPGSTSGAALTSDSAARVAHVTAHGVCCECSAGRAVQQAEGRECLACSRPSLSVPRAHLEYTTPLGPAAQRCARDLAATAYPVIRYPQCPGNARPMDRSRMTEASRGPMAVGMDGNSRGAARASGRSAVGCGSETPARSALRQRGTPVRCVAGPGQAVWSCCAAAVSVADARGERTSWQRAPHSGGGESTPRTAFAHC
jgi:hypothetical protein